MTMAVFWGGVALAAAIAYALWSRPGLCISAVIDEHVSLFAQIAATALGAQLVAIVFLTSTALQQPMARRDDILVSTAAGITLSAFISLLSLILLIWRVFSRGISISPTSPFARLRKRSATCGAFLILTSVLSVLLHVVFWMPYLVLSTSLLD
ncbi:MAG: hypothetical protein OXM54_13920 [Acidimicrobiaceae bacterium]|nr:hypothetical protein [Acidimicrobiaceae bacterium]